jgi:4-amino-4-deoxy-L-arabinose transferase-like glycosyltransferase
MTARAWDRVLVGLLLVSAVLCFLHLSAPDMQVWDEGDNALVILESIDAGHPFQLQRHGEPYFDKPPLWYWLTSVMVMLLGPTEMAFRIVSAVAGFLLMMAVMLLARRLYSSVAAAAAGCFILAVRQLYISRPAEIFSTHNLRSADSDALMLLLAFASFAALAARVRGRSWGLPVAALFSGLALMTKGPPGLLPVVAFAAWQVISPRRLRLQIREVLLALAVFLAVTVPWHAAMAWIWGDIFLDRYPRYVLFRVSSGLPGHVPEPTYYWRILSNHRVFFGLELLLVAVAAALWDRGRAAFRRAGPLLVLLITLILLHLSQTKIAWYTLPLYPYGALLVAALVDRLTTWRQRRGEGGRSGRALPFAALMAGVLMALFALHNVYTVVRLEDGSTRVFFSRVAAVCGTDTIYADERETLHLRFLLRRYEMRRGTPESAECWVERTDTPGMPGRTDAVVVTEGGGFRAWQWAPPA